MRRGRREEEEEVKQKIMVIGVHDFRMCIIWYMVIYCTDMPCIHTMVFFVQTIGYILLFLLLRSHICHKFNKEKQNKTKVIHHTLLHVVHVTTRGT